MKMMSNWLLSAGLLLPYRRKRFSIATIYRYKIPSLSLTSLHIGGISFSFFIGYHSYSFIVLYKNVYISGYCLLDTWVKLAIQDGICFLVCRNGD